MPGVKIPIKASSNAAPTRFTPLDLRIFGLAGLTLGALKPYSTFEGIFSIADELEGLGST